MHDHEFNTHALRRLVEYASRARCFRRGTENRAVATQVAIAESRMLIGRIVELEAKFAADGARAGWLWSV